MPGILGQDPARASGLDSDCDHFKTTLILQLTKLLPCGITPARDPDRIGRRVTLSVPAEAGSRSPAGWQLGGWENLKI